MGIYSNNRFSSTTTMVDYDAITEADDNYNAVTGCAMAFLESQQNDLALFNATIYTDFQEVAALQEGYEVINESVSDVIERIKQIFVKLLAKIKGIFQAFLAKLRGTFSSNKNLYDDYVKQINKYYNWKDFKVKNFRKLKGGGTDAAGKIDDVGAYNVDRMSYSISLTGKSQASAGTNNMANSTLAPLVKDYLDDKDIDSEDINKILIQDRLGSNDLKKELDDDLGNMNEAFMDCVFEDADTEDEWKTSDIINGIVGSVLKEGTKIQDNVEKCNKNLNNNINKIINQLNKIAGDVNKVYSGKNGESFTSKTVSMSAGEKMKGTMNTTDFEPTQGSGWIITYKSDGSAYLDKNGNQIIDTDKDKLEDYKKTMNDEERKKVTLSRKKMGNNFTYDNKNNKSDLETLSKVASILQRVAGQEQELITKFTTARLTATKFLVSQARKVWASAAAYSSTEHKNEGYEFYTAFGEAYAYDFMSDMEALD